MKRGKKKYGKTLFPRRLRNPAAIAAFTQGIWNLEAGCDLGVNPVLFQFCVSLWGTGELPWKDKGQYSVEKMNVWVPQWNRSGFPLTAAALPKTHSESPCAHCLGFLCFPGITPGQIAFIAFLWKLWQSQDLFFYKTISLFEAGRGEPREWFSLQLSYRNTESVFDMALWKFVLCSLRGCEMQWRRPRSEVCLWVCTVQVYPVRSSKSSSQAQCLTDKTLALQGAEGLLKHFEDLAF